MTFGTRWTNTREVLNNQRFGSQGNTQSYQIATAKLTGADRTTGARIDTIAASQVDAVVDINPFGASLPGSKLFLSTNHEVDVKLGSVSSDAMRNTLQLSLVTSGGISAIFLTTGANATIVQVEVMGGSAASVSTSLPLP